MLKQSRNDTMLLQLVILITFSLCAANISEETDNNESKFQNEFEWTFINFTWKSEEDYKKAINNKEYIPENNAMAGIKFYGVKFYIAMPRIRSGVPVTLGYISSDSSKKNPLVTPFPSWTMNKLDECDKIQSVQSMEIDRNGTMWVLDGFRIKRNWKCPPKLLLFDLEDNNKLLQTFIFPEIICLTKGGFLNDIVVDGEDFAYITDSSSIDPGLIIFSRKENKAWKIRDSSMFPEVEASNFFVGNHNFTTLAPIDGIALSPSHGSSRTVYYCSLSGFNLYSISTEILKNEETCLKGDWRFDVKKIGRKEAQSDGLAVDSDGNLFYGLLPLYGVGKWNIYEEFSKAKVLDMNNETMIWTDSFAFDNKGYLYLLANNIHKFFDDSYKLVISDEVKFRILKSFIDCKSYMY